LRRLFTPFRASPGSAPVIKRLNTYGLQHGDDARVGRRDFGAEPLTVGEGVCHRVDCVYNKERLYASSRRRGHSAVTTSKYVSEDAAVAMANGGHRGVGGMAGRPPPHERYRTASAAVAVLVRTLAAQGVYFPVAGDDAADVLPLTVADICGRPTDAIASFFADAGATTTVRTNDAHAAASDAPGHTQLDASAPDFVVRFLAAAGEDGAGGDGGQGGIDYVITSPPYSLQVPILRNALHLAKHLVAAKLPLDFLAPGPQTTDRRAVLVAHPPDAVIPLTHGECNEFYTVRMTEAWFVWTIKRGESESRGGSISGGGSSSSSSSLVMSQSGRCMPTLKPFSFSFA
jgi:hypothetical protein